MSNADESAHVVVVGSETTPTNSVEYDYSMAATATVSGPRGTLRIHRRYHALPRHNDVVETGGSDSNDELLDRADEIYVHSKFYAVTEETDEYFLDRHETWQSGDPETLSNEETFFEVCGSHHLANVRADYTQAMDERQRKTNASG